MSYILNIDTAVTTGSVCLSNNGELTGIAINHQQQDHAAWLQPAIKKLLYDAGISIGEVRAIAVSIGPGSYTGLRIGLASAKGLCYALNIPLIAVGTLDMMAAATADKGTDLICPMIDARRAEVFTAVYNHARDVIVAPCAMILEVKSFIHLLDEHTILFFGNGSTKFKKMITHKNARFETIEANALQLMKISNNRLLLEDFNSVAYTEPMYIKNFHSSVK